MSKRRSIDKNPQPIPVAALPEEQLSRIESRPDFQRMIKESIEDERAGRTYTNDEVERMLASNRRRRS
jgi:hypothetical protein